MYIVTGVMQCILIERFFNANVTVETSVRLSGLHRENGVAGFPMKSRVSLRQD